MGPYVSVSAFSAARRSATRFGCLAPSRQPARTSPSSGVDGTRRCSVLIAWPSPPSTLRCRPRARLLSPRSLTAFAGGESLEGCAGCCYRGPGSEPRANPPRPTADVNDLSPHRYDLIDVGGFFELKGKRQLDYISSQGCHFRCAFCSDPFVYNRQWTGLDPERMGEELEHLWRHCGVGL